MVKNTHILSVVFEFWRPKCIKKYAYEQFIEIKIVQTLNDIIFTSCVVVNNRGAGWGGGGSRIRYSIKNFGLFVIR